MNYAIIIAGGCGARMGQDIPKQFINASNPALAHLLPIPALLSLFSYAPYCRFQKKDFTGV